MDSYSNSVCFVAAVLGPLKEKTPAFKGDTRFGSVPSETGCRLYRLQRIHKIAIWILGDRNG